MSGGKFTEIDPSGISCASFVGGSVGNDKDKDDGCVIELSVPKSMLGISDGYVSVNLIMNNTDKKETAKDELSPSKISDISTWIKIGIAE